MNADAILHFWFTELTKKQHFAKDAVNSLCGILVNTILF